MSNFTALKFPTNIPWELVPNCTCRIPLNNCFKPAIYSKPIICVNERILGIESYLETGPREVDMTMIYMLIAIVIVLQIAMIVGYGWLNKNRIILHCNCPRPRFLMRNHQRRQQQPQQNRMGQEGRGEIEPERSSPIGVFFRPFSRPRAKPVETPRILASFLGSTVTEASTSGAGSTQASHQLQGEFSTVDLSN